MKHLNVKILVSLFRFSFTTYEALWYEEMEDMKTLLEILKNLIEDLKTLIIEVLKPYLRFCKP
jgi:predicted outer membrane lipoprotein